MVSVLMNPLTRLLGYRLGLSGQQRLVGFQPVGAQHHAVEPDLADLVDDDGGRRHLGLLQHMIEDGRLAAAEKSGQQGYRGA